MSSKSIKLKKIKHTHPDKLYQILFERYIKDWYTDCDKVILHHATTLLDGKIITACELYFGKEIVFVNLHVEIDLDYNSLYVSNNQKLEKYLKDK